jgi:hypothetical protein
VFTSCITIKDTVVDEANFLGNKTNNTNIYSKESNGTLINPFNINTNNWGLGDIKRLMLVEFEDLQGYRSIELQVVENNGKQGGLVIMYYANKDQADVYHTPNLSLNKEMYANILNNTEIIATDIQYHFKEKEGLLQASLNFKDKFGNDINMLVNEKLGEMQPCGLLAPIGGEANSPEFMTIVFMKHFKFLSQNEKEIHVSINGDKAELIKLPIRVNGIKGFQTKYSMEPITVSWNMKTIGILNKLRVNENNLYKQEDIEIECLNNKGHLEIERFTGIQQGNLVMFRFSPAIPDLISLRNNIVVKGKFSMSVDSTTGIIAGEYIVTKTKDVVSLTIKPTKGYSPVPGKAWMKKMVWTAKIRETDNQFTIKSQWTKK